MAELSVTYMGLTLKNPIIVASSSLTGTVDGVRRCEEAGAGAVVLKSIFEEQIESETREVEDQSMPLQHPEAMGYLRQAGIQLSEETYLGLVREAKKAVSIPVIASLNCVHPDWWTNYAAKIAEAGADAIELNIALLPTDPNRPVKEIERTYRRIIESVCGKVDLPVAAKIGPYFTSLPRVARELTGAGAAALVLFNRFYQLDIDIEDLELKSGYHYSSPEEIYVPLRWIAILSSQVSSDLAATTGIHDGAGVVKQILAGARAAQLCSTLYRSGLDRIGQTLGELEGWMDRHGYGAVEDFRGRMSMEVSDDPEHYERLQYIKAYSALD